jgi:hypothetical protein
MAFRGSRVRSPSSPPAGRREGHQAALGGLLAFWLLRCGRACAFGCFAVVVLALLAASLWVERVSIEPFKLSQPVRYDVVLDRLTHWFQTSREWIKKAVIMDGLYVLNNPWSLQSMEKHTTYCAMMKLGMPIPETWMIPPKERITDNPDVHPTMERYGASGSSRRSASASATRSS